MESPEVIVISEEEYARHSSDYDGLCLSCGEWSSGGVEPDAEDYECEVCGESAVCGTEQALLMGGLDIGES
jgi:hypothetical protein